MDDESGESQSGKRGRITEWIKRRSESGMLKLVEGLRVEDTAAYNEMFLMNCETFEELLTTIGTVTT